MKISILTVSFNSGAFLEKAIASVLQQDYSNYEHIIIDGDSTDDTKSILTKYSHLIWKSEKDKGQSDAMNKAFNLASGDIIVYLNADDYFEENIFSKVISEFNTTKSDIVVGDLYLEMNKIKRRVVPDISFDKIVYPQKYIFPYNPVSYFYKREVQNAVGHFPLDENYAMDYWFLLRAFDKFCVSKTPIPFGTFYLSEINKTSVNTDNNTRRIAKEYIKSKLFLKRLEFFILNIYFDIINLVTTGNWFKNPLKYLVYILFFKKKFPSFQTFKKIGFRELI